MLTLKGLAVSYIRVTHALYRDGGLGFWQNGLSLHRSPGAFLDPRLPHTQPVPETSVYIPIASGREVRGCPRSPGVTYIAGTCSQTVCLAGLLRGR